MKAPTLSPFAREPEVRSKPKRVLLPLFSSNIPAGFPSPAAEYLEEQLDLNEYIYQHPVTTVCFRVKDDAMLEDGIAPGDLLVLNRTQQAHDGDVVVAYIDGGYTARWWEQHGKSTGVRLTASNSHYAPVLLYPDDETRFLGTVTYRIRKHGSGGWPIPEKDLFEIKPDLNLTMVRNRAATFLVRVEGDSMEGYGIYPTDILVVDRSQQPNDGDVVVAIVDGDFAVKYLEKTLLWVRLLSSNPKYKPIEITSEYEGFELWGKVTYSIHNLNNHVRTGGRQLVLRELRKGI